MKNGYLFFYKLFCGVSILFSCTNSLATLTSTPTSLNAKYYNKDLRHDFKIINLKEIDEIYLESGQAFPSIALDTLLPLNLVEIVYFKDGTSATKEEIISSNKIKFLQNIFISFRNATGTDGGGG